MKYIEVCRHLKDRNRIIEKPEQTDMYFHDYSGALFYSVFDHTEEYSNYVKLNKSVENYSGPVSSEYIPFDFDGPNAINDVWTLITKIIFSKNLIDDVSVFFSGNKGFHVFVKSDKYMEPSIENPIKMKTAVEKMAAKYDLKTLDMSIYKRTGIIRAPNSKHDKTGLFKIPLYAGEIPVLSLEHIKDMAKNKRNLKVDDTINKFIRTMHWKI